MRITCWGARGSISVSGPEFVRYGGETTCLELHDAEDRLIIIDAGTGIRRLGNALMKDGPVEAFILFTHAHWDHLSGFPFFKPVFLASTRLSIVCCAFKREFVSQMLASTMAAPYFPVPLAKVKATIDYPSVCNGGFEINGLAIETVPLSHPNGGVSYKFSEGGHSFVFMTDNELGHRHANGLEWSAYLDFCRGADLLIHDAEYTPEEYERYKGYGHSTYVEALNLALAAGVKRLGLFHHNQDRTDQEVDALVADCQARIKAAGADVEVMALAAGMNLEV